MKILDVILLNQKTPMGTLSYFKEEDISVGSVVEVPFRTKTVRALVIDSKDVSSVKGDLKSSDFSLKKIKSVITESYFSKEFISTIKNLAGFYATTPSLIFYTMTLSTILKSATLEESKKEEKIKINQPINIIQSDDKERGDYYKSSIREAFAKGQSVFFVVPTISDIDKWYELLKKGIENYTVRLYGTQTEKTQKTSFNKAMKEKHPILLIGTPVILSVQRKDLGFIVIEHESSPYYRSITKPYIDGREFAKVYSKQSGIKLLFGDSLLRFETLAKQEDGEFIDVRPIVFRQQTNINLKVIDMHEEDKKKGFSVLSDEVKELIQKTKEEKNSRIFLFSFRRGIYTSSVCRDCGNVEKCSNCGQVLMVSGEEGKNEKRIMLCGRCGKRERADRLCSICGSWDLIPLGIGSKRVYEEVKELVDEDTEIILIDKETVKTKKSLEKAISDFGKAKKCIVIGTEMALDYLDKNFDHVVAISFDTLFSIPLYDANEHIAHLCIDLAQKSNRNFIIQTRSPNNELIKAFETHNLPNFIREDIDTRKQLGYPPFKRIIKIKWKGGEKEYGDAVRLSKIFDEYEPYKWHRLLQNSLHELNILIKIDRKKWSSNKGAHFDGKLEEILRNTSDFWDIEIDPPNVL